MNSVGNNVEYKPPPQRTAPFFGCCVDLLCLLVTCSVERDWNVFLEYAIKYSFHVLFVCPSFQGFSLNFEGDNFNFIIPSLIYSGTLI